MSDHQSGEQLPPPSQAFGSLLSLSLFHGSEFNLVVSAPRGPGRSLSVFELKRETIKKKKKIKKKLDFSCRVYADATATQHFPRWRLLTTVVNVFIIFQEKNNVLGNSFLSLCSPINSKRRE